MLTAKRIDTVGAEPITLAEAYQQLRLDPTDGSDVTGRPDDPLIEIYCKAARRRCERFTGRSLVLQDFEVAFDAWPETIELPMPPFVSVLAITIDDGSSENGLDASEYRVDTHTGEFAIVKPTATWPALGTDAVVRIRFRAGYGDESEAAEQLPEDIKLAMLLTLTDCYDNRNPEGVVDEDLPPYIRSWLRPYRVILGFA